MAEQYYQSMSIDEIPDEVIIVDDESPIEEDEEESES